MSFSSIKLLTLLLGTVLLGGLVSYSFREQARLF